MSDDGAGIHLIRELQNFFCGERQSMLASLLEYCVEKELSQYIIAKGICLLEVGTSPLYYLEEISRAKTLIVIDAVKGGEKAGSIYCFKEDDLNINSNPIRDFHGISILEVISLARELRKLPTKIIIYGIEPKNTNPGKELSLSVKNIIPKLVELIIEEICQQI